MSVRPMDTSVTTVTVSPASQSMTKDDAVERILCVETRPERKARNVCGIVTAALYGLVGCPLCCCFFCGCCGKFPAAPMVPSDEGVKDAVARLPREERVLFNCESHLMAAALGTSAPCAACVCCGMCGTCGPYGTAKLVALARSK